MCRNGLLAVVMVVVVGVIGWALGRDSATVDQIESPGVVILKQTVKDQAEEIRFWQDWQGMQKTGKVYNEVTQEWVPLPYHDEMIAYDELKQMWVKFDPKTQMWVGIPNAKEAAASKVAN